MVHHGTPYTILSSQRRRHKHSADTVQQKTLGDFVWRWQILSQNLGKLVSWCFEPSQPQRIASGLNTNFTLSPTYSFHKSSYHKSYCFSLYIFSGHSAWEPASSRVTYFILQAYTGTSVSHSKHREKNWEGFWKKCRWMDQEGRNWQEIPGSRHSMHGYTWTCSRLKREKLWALCSQQMSLKFLHLQNPQRVTATVISGRDTIHQITKAALTVHMTGHIMLEESWRKCSWMNCKGRNLQRYILRE